MDNIINALDWFRYVSLAIGTFKHGRLHCFTWLDNPTGYEVEHTLRQYDIHAYGRGTWTEKEPGPDGKPVKHLRRFMYVNQAQAEWAEYILCCLCVPIDGAWANPKNQRAWGRPLPRPWKAGAKRQGVVEMLSDWWAGLTR